MSNHIKNKKKEDWLATFADKHHAEVYLNHAWSGGYHNLEIFEVYE